MSSQGSNVALGALIVVGMFVVVAGAALIGLTLLNSDNGSSNNNSSDDDSSWIPFSGVWDAIFIPIIVASQKKRNAMKKDDYPSNSYGELDDSQPRSENQMDTTSFQRPVRNYCSNCGSYVAPDSRYCDSCGERLD